jgi:hypothetical protein
MILSSRSFGRHQYKNVITMIVLFLINLLNFMDRFAIAGIHSLKRKSCTRLIIHIKVCWEIFNVILNFRMHKVVFFRQHSSVVTWL